MPLSCPCGCDVPVKAGNTYATRGCNGRVRFTAMTNDERRYYIGRFHRNVKPWQREEWGRMGGRTSNLTLWGQLLEQWQAMGPREALRAAYKRGYNAGLLRKRRAELRRTA